MASKQRQLTQSQIQEEYLLIQAAQKEPRRFGVLYEKYYRQIFVFIYKRVDNEEQAGDICSQVFLKAMTNLPKYKFKGVPFSAWLYRIAVNEVNQFFRKAQNQRSISMERANIGDIVEEVDESDTEDNIKHMLKAMQFLSPDDVQMIELRYFEKLPFREVAEIYNITENNAKVRMYRILGRLKKAMLKVQKQTA